MTDRRQNAQTPRAAPADSNSGRRISVDIDRLVLDGLPITAIDGERLRDAVTARLTTLISERGVPVAWTTSGATAHVGGDSIGLPRGVDPSVMGARIADGIYGRGGR